ncbi:MAG: Hint domain-containing protein, partial [Pseudomonadota bacterium]
NIGSTTYTSFITCFAEGTEIDTGSGVCPVEEISPGQLIWTRDNGLAPVSWVGCADVEAKGAFAPVVFAPGSLGNTSELVVSQQHRMLLTGYPVELLFGTPDALIAAKHLCGLPGIALRPGGHVRYYHLMFDRHEIIRAHGVLSESFFVTPLSLRGLAQDARTELLHLFPGFQTEEHGFGCTAAPTLKPHEAHVALHHLFGAAPRPALAA